MNNGKSPKTRYCPLPYYTRGVDEGQVISRVINVGVDDDLGEPEPHEQNVAVGQKGTCKIARSILTGTYVTFRIPTIASNELFTVLRPWG